MPHSSRCTADVAGAVRAPQVPGGLLVTIMRWPPARFTSALEQFSMPQQTGVPCAHTRQAQTWALITS